MSDDVVQEVVRFLESIEDNYPSGLALKARLAEAKETSNNNVEKSHSTTLAKSNEQLVFATLADDPEKFLTSPAGQLAVAAIEKGLKKSLQSVQLLAEKDSNSLAKKVEDSLSKGNIYGVVLLGQSAVQSFSQDKIERGMWFLFRDCPVIVTEALEDSLADINAKKNFWNDLKAVMQRFGW